MKTMQVTFEPEKDTKNTIRFKEVVEGPLGVAMIGTLYVPKATLAQLNYTGTDHLVVELQVL